MIEHDADVAILGAGFGGSTMALVLRSIGLRPVLLDRGSHPRFAIGESSTPVADLVLRELAQRYELPRLAPLSRYGSWQAAYPHLACGLKRGFSYFRHRPEEPFRPSAAHHNELLVAASADDASSDTHWFRADFDGFLADEAVAAGVPLVDQLSIESVRMDERQCLVTGSRQGAPVRVRARFAIDASGEGGVLARQLNIPVTADGLRTNARSVFAHFRGVRLWSDLLAAAGGQVADHPYLCDDAALHHVIDGGWMWVLRFNNGVTSAGFMLDLDAHPPRPDLAPRREWDEIIRRYPTLAAQFAEAEVVGPPGGMKQTGRLQRQAARFVGPNWAMLPTTAGFFDALHSTGNAHTLCGIQRLGRLFEEHWDRDTLPAALLSYEANLREELKLMDLLVHGCYLAFHDFRLLTSFAMWYFAAAEVSEHRRRIGIAEGDSFVQAHDPAFRGHVQDCYRRIQELAGGATEEEVVAFERDVAQRIAPYNIGGLCDPARKNMYPFTCVR